MLKRGFLIVGLGNPGQAHQNTWHNLGFLAIDQFAEQNDFPDFAADKWSRALVAKKEFEGKFVTLAKPQTFMNESGRSVVALLKKFSVSTNDLIVVHDDADLAVGTIRVAKGRGTAGHKGVESIVRSLKTKNFIRLRAGSRPKNYVPGSKMLAKFVLKKMATADRKMIEETLIKIIAALDLILKGQTQKAMSEFN